VGVTATQQREQRRAGCGTSALLSAATPLNLDPYHAVPEALTLYPYPPPHACAHACEYFKARAFRLEPGAAAQGSYYVCDGEMLARGPLADAGGTSKAMPLDYAPVSVAVRQGLARVFCSSLVHGSHQLGALAV
jgi:hypothetical protein